MNILISSNSYFSSIMYIVIYIHYIKKLNTFFLICNYVKYKRNQINLLMFLVMYYNVLAILQLLS